MISEEVRTLKNGVRLVLVRNETQNSMAALVAVGVGSRDEEPGLHGAAHFIEHMRFKGTKRRPSFRDISLFVEARGGQHNAWTDKEMTAFHVQMAEANSRDAVDVMHDVFANGQFRKADFDLEKGVILEEVSGYENDPDSIAHEAAERLAHDGSPLAHPIAGTTADVQGLTLGSLVRFHERGYVPQRTVVVLAGAVTDDAVELAEARFGKARGPASRPRADPPKTARFFSHFSPAPTDRVHLTVTLPGLPATHWNGPAARLVSYALGGLSSSRLMMKIREERGLTYGVGSHAVQRSDHGVLFVGMSVERKNFAEAFRILVREVVEMGKNGPTAAELKTVKSFVRGSTSINLDDPMTVATRAATGVLNHGKYLSPEETIARYEAVRLSDAKRAAAATCRKDGMGISVAGPKAAGKEIMAAVRAAMSG